MLKKLQNINTSWFEFFIKFPIVFLIIMPVCMGGCFWIGFQLDASLKIHIFKLIFPIIGSVVGLYFTGLLLILGHARETASGTSKEPAASSDAAARGTATHAAIPKPGYFTAFQR